MDRPADLFAMSLISESYHRVPSVGFLQKNILEVINRLLDHAPEYTQLMKSHFVEWAFDLPLLFLNEIHLMNITYLCYSLLL